MQAPAAVCEDECEVTNCKRRVPLCITCNEFSADLCEECSKGNPHGRYCALHKPPSCFMDDHYDPPARCSIDGCTNQVPFCEKCVTADPHMGICTGMCSVTYSYCNSCKRFVKKNESKSGILFIDVALDSSNL